MNKQQMETQKKQLEEARMQLEQQQQQLEHAAREQQMQMRNAEQQLAQDMRTQEIQLVAQQKELAAARARLEQAAREVAELSGRTYGEHIAPYVDAMHFGQRRAMLGINIGGVRDDGKSDGVEILGVSPDSPADKAGLKTGDVLLGINGESLSGSSSRESSNKLLRRMEEFKPGEKVIIEYIRNGKTVKAEIETVAMQPPAYTFAFGDRNFNVRIPGTGDNWPGQTQFFRLTREWGELELAEISPTLGKYFGTEEGVLVVTAPRETTLELEDGDVILSIDGRKPNDPNHALRILRSYAPGESLTLDIMRDKRRRKLEVTVPQADSKEPAAYFIQRPMKAPQPPRAMTAPRPSQQFILKRNRELGI